jgi:transposase
MISAAGDPGDGRCGAQSLGPTLRHYVCGGWTPSIAPKRLLELDYNFLFRWFVGLSIDDLVWDVTVFTKKRDRLLKGKMADEFFTACWRKRASVGCSPMSTLR